MQEDAVTAEKPQPHKIDIIVVGAGIAGLWVAGILKRRGYSVLVFEQDAIGGVQTFASQGMIHGGQKYTLTGKAGDHALSIAAMPARWQAAFDGCGDLDLAGVDFASQTQVMWPAGGVVASGAVLAAAKLVNAETEKLGRDDFPDALAGIPKFKGPVYQLPEKVMNIRSLVAALSRPLAPRILRGKLKAVLPDGQVAFHCDGVDVSFHAQMVVVTAGTGNEEALQALKLTRQMTQRRPLRQVMVRSLPYALYGHGIVGSPKPRVTVTASRLDDGGYVWYLGGALAEAGASLDEEETLALALHEMTAMFPHIDWQQKEWATWYGERAEPYDPAGHLPPGPTVHQRGRVLVGWPAKLTFAPALGDRVLSLIEQHGIRPVFDVPLLDWPQAALGSYPWETARWRKL